MRYINIKKFNCTIFIAIMIMKSLYIYIIIQNAQRESLIYTWRIAVGVNRIWEREPSVSHDSLSLSLGNLRVERGEIERVIASALFRPENHCSAQTRDGSKEADSLRARYTHTRAKRERTTSRSNPPQSNSCASHKKFRLELLTQPIYRVDGKVYCCVGWYRAALGNLDMCLLIEMKN